MTTTSADVESQPSGEMNAEEFRRAGHRLIDLLADYYQSLATRPVTSGESVSEIARVIAPQSLPATGRPGTELLEDVAPLLMEHSLHNGHPRFFGYITSSAAPLGALADLLAAGINQNCGLRDLSPAANAIEMQTVQWLAELIGFPTPCGGIMVSGGNMANILAFLAARHAQLKFDVRRQGVFAAVSSRPRIYASRATHTWIEKAADVAGLGTDSIRWIATDAEQRIEPSALIAAIGADRTHGDLPLMVVGTAGNVSTGAIDPLPELAQIARDNGLWFHVDGAYGAPAACLPEAPEALRGLALADSVALDPHKWLFAPIEAACTLVRDPEALRGAFSFRPPYYRLGGDADAGGIDYFEHGLQNTRAFRALKVWLGLRQWGRDGYASRIRDNIALAARLHAQAQAHPEIEAGTRHLSITTFRFRPADAQPTPEWAGYLDRLNEALLAELQRGGEVYVSNSVLDSRYFLRSCIVNFRTQTSDIDALIATVVRRGRQCDANLRPNELRLDRPADGTDVAATAIATGKDQ